jgi:hypothetical protein
MFEIIYHCTSPGLTSARNAHITIVHSVINRRTNLRSRCTHCSHMDLHAAAWSLGAYEPPIHLVRHTISAVYLSFTTVAFWLKDSRHPSLVVSPPIPDGIMVGVKTEEEGARL